MTDSLKKYIAEFIGTFVLVFFSCGTAIFISSYVDDPSARYLIIALAFGLSIVAMAYSIGHISGCHVNPAVSFAMLILKKISLKDFTGYIVAQFLGALVGSTLLFGVASLTNVGDTGLGVNGFGSGYGLEITAFGALIVEVILTFVFVLAIIGVTSSEKTSPIAGIVIGFVLTFVHILGIPLTGTSVNPARSLAPAIILAFDGELIPLAQVWVFILAPLAGAALAALASKYLFPFKKAVK